MTTEAPTLQIRNLSFATGSEVPRHWHGGRRSVTRFFDNLSVFFPEGERFFVASVQAYRHVIEGDPELRRQVRDFSGQEGVHSREHRRYNEMLREQGIDVDAMEREVKAILRFARLLPKRQQLATTCALEHFTALMGHAILRDPRLLEGAHETMAKLWRWHAAEENEHKSVPYDVFVAAGGTYPERVAIMLLTSAIFWAKVVEQQARFMAADGDLFSAKEWAALVRYLFVDPGGMGEMWRLWLEWFRPDFHPSQIDSTPELDAWIAGLSAQAA